MPVLVHAIPEYLDELFQNGGLTAIALLRELSGVVIMAVDVAFVLIVRILRAEDGRTDTAREVFDMILAIQCGDVRSTKGALAGVTEQIESAKVVCLAKRVLVRRLIRYREELGCDYFMAVLDDVRQWFR